MSDSRVTSLVTMSASRVTLLVKIFESRETLPVKIFESRVTLPVKMSESRVKLPVKMSESRETLPVKMSESGVRFLFQGWKRRAELCTYIAHRCQSSEISYSVHSEFQRIYAGICRRRSWLCYSRQPRSDTGCCCTRRYL